MLSIEITSHAIGWQLEDELREIERVVKKGGHAVHLSGYPDDAEHTPLHTRLTSPQWRYVCSRYKEKEGWKRKYWKQI
jgi:ubiquinone/menaquinone biosynthesis C-methylase UbiE